MPIFRICRNRVIQLFGIIPLVDKVDVIPKESETVKNADIGKVNETGMDRLRRMFSLDDNDNISPEVSSILQVACMSAFIGALYGGMVNSRTAYADFINSNQASVFKDHLEAKKKLQDKVTTSFGRGAFRWSWRLSFFSTTYITISTTISVYRGKFGIVEHLAAGMVSGFLYKFPAGPRAWVVGSVLGCALGAFAGSLTYGMLTLTGSSWEEVRYWQYQWKESRNIAIRDAIRKQTEKDELLLLHDAKVNDGKFIDSIPVVDDNSVRK